MVLKRWVYKTMSSLQHSYNHGLKFRPLAITIYFALIYYFLTILHNGNFGSRVGAKVEAQNLQQSQPAITAHKPLFQPQHFLIFPKFHENGCTIWRTAKVPFLRYFRHLILQIVCAISSPSHISHASDSLKSSGLPQILQEWIYCLEKGWLTSAALQGGQKDTGSGRNRQMRKDALPCSDNCLAWWDSWGFSGCSPIVSHYWTGVGKLRIPAPLYNTAAVPNLHAACTRPPVLYMRLLSA